MVNHPSDAATFKTQKTQLKHKKYKNKEDGKTWQKRENLKKDSSSIEHI